MKTKMVRTIPKRDLITTEDEWRSTNDGRDFSIR